MVSPYEANNNEYAMQTSGARSGSSYKNTQHKFSTPQTNNGTAIGSSSQERGSHSYVGTPPDQSMLAQATSSGMNFRNTGAGMCRPSSMSGRGTTGAATSGAAMSSAYNVESQPGIFNQHANFMSTP